MKKIKITVIRKSYKFDPTKYLFKVVQHYRGGIYFVYDITERELDGVSILSYMNLSTGNKYNRPAREFSDVVFFRKSYKFRFTIVEITKVSDVYTNNR